MNFIFKREEPKPIESLPLYRDPYLPIEQRVSDLLGRMTLEEKLAQLTVFGQIDAMVAGTFSLDQLAEVAANGAGAVSRLGLNRSPAETVAIYNQIQENVGRKNK